MYRDHSLALLPVRSPKLASRPLTRGLATLALLAFAATSVAPPAGAQNPKIGLIVVAHGADSAWNAAVRETVSLISWPGGPVKLAFLMGPEAMTATWDSAATQLQRDGVHGIVAVPFMVSSYGSHVRQIQYYAGELPAMPVELAAMGHAHDGHVRITVPVRVTPALDSAREIGEALTARWNRLPDIGRHGAVVLVAHGPNSADDAERWMRNLTSATSALAANIAPQPLRISLLRDDAPPDVRAAAVLAMRDTITSLAHRSRDSVTVLPLLISRGAITAVTIPADIAGLPVRYFPVSLAPHQALARWIERIALDARNDLVHAASPNETIRPRQRQP